jgi:hypothetical protein
MTLIVELMRFDSWSYQIFWEVVGLERGPLSLVSTTEDLLSSKSRESDLENWDYRRRLPDQVIHNTKDFKPC